MLKQIAFVLSVGLVAGCGNGCNRKKPAENIEPSPPPPPNLGSAGSAATAPAKPLGADELAKHFDDCYAMLSAAKWEDFKGCFTADATREAPGDGMPAQSGAQAVVDSIKLFKTPFSDLKGDVALTLINGHNLVAITLLSGTHDGPLKSPMGEIPATKNKVGILVAQSFEFDETGHAKHELDFLDDATLLGQAAPSKDHPVRPALDKPPVAKEVAIAKDDAKEKANLEVAKAALEAFNKHDAKAFGEHLTDDTVWSEQPEAKDWTKKLAISNAQDVWKAFTDLKMNLSSAWAAGDYVVMVATMEGTNDGALPALGLKTATKKKLSVPYLAIHKLDNGKIKQTWIFDQGLAFAIQLGLVPAPTPPAGSASGAGASGSAAKPAAPAAPAKP